MISQVLIITTATSQRQVDALRERIFAKVNDLKPRDATASEVARRLQAEIESGDVQVVDRDAMADADMLKLGAMLEVGQRGAIIIEGEESAPDELVPAKTLRRRERKRESARAKAGRHTYVP